MSQLSINPGMPGASGRPPRPFRAIAPAVASTLAYLAPTEEAAYTYMYEPPAGVRRENFSYEAGSASIADARALSTPASIEREGFELWEAESAVRDFDDADEVRGVYYREAADLALAVTGAKSAHVFDHLVRRREPGRPALTMGRAGDGSKPSANGRVHCDYSEASGRGRLELVLRSADAIAQVRRYAIVNVWRSIAGPVADTPLAVCDARTVAAGDLVACEIRYQSRTGEIYLVRRSPSHRWFYYPGMDRNEALVFKQYDSSVNAAVRFVPHSDFDLPAVPAGAPLRESIELRCLVVY
jgi:hypothetical protein